MKPLTQSMYRSAFVAGLLCMLGVYFVSQEITDRTLSSLREAQVADVEVLRAEIMELTQSIGKGTITDFATTLLPDCSISERTVFDNRLTKLDSGLTKQELQELDTLFARCAPTTAVARAAAVYQLEQKISVLEMLYQQMQLVTPHTYTLNTLNELLEVEYTIVKKSFEVVALQKEIINALLLGMTVEEVRANELRERGVALRTELITLTTKANELRTAITW